jgi:hypothetical protein
MSWAPNPNVAPMMVALASSGSQVDADDAQNDGDGTMKTKKRQTLADEGGHGRHARPGTWRARAGGGLVGDLLQDPADRLAAQFRHQDAHDDHHDDGHGPDDEVVHRLGRAVVDPGLGQEVVEPSSVVRPAPHHGREGRQ